MDSLIDDLMRDRDLMKTASKELKKRGRELAEAEVAYQSAKARRALEMRDAGVPATLITTVIKGDGDVAELLFKRMIAESEYSSAQEALNVYKLDAKLLEAQIDREWRG